MGFEDEHEKIKMRGKIEQLQMDLKCADAGKQAWVDEFDKLVRENYELSKENKKLKKELSILKKELEMLKSK